MSRIASTRAFQILGVTPTDDFATIRQAWIKLVKENHPDVAGGDLAVLTAKLTRINDAYDALCWHSPEKVRIREERKAEADRRANKADRPDSAAASRPEQNHEPDRRTTSQRPAAAETHRTTASSATASSPQRPDRRTDTDRRQMRNGTIHDRADLAWASLSVDDKFKAVQSFCGAEPVQHSRPRPLATV